MPTPLWSCSTRASLSLLYNGTFMVPELILTMIAAAVLFALPQTKKVLFEMGLDKKVA